MSHFRCRDCNSLTTTSDNIRPSTIVDDYGNPVGCLNCGSNNVFREFNQIKEEAPEDAPTTNIVTKDIIPNDNIDTLEEILEAFRKQCVNKENTGSGFENTLQALNLYIKEKEKLARQSELEHLKYYFEKFPFDEFIELYVKGRIEEQRRK